MAKALFLSLPLHGHTNPTLALIRGLVERGEEVSYYSTDSFAAQIEQEGGRYRPYRNAFLKDMRQLPDRMEALAWLLLRTTAEVLDEELETFRAERPDYVITDSVAPWGHWVAELLGAPVVTSISTFAFNRRVLAFGVARGVRPKSARVLVSKLRYMAKALTLMRHLRRRYGVSGPGLARSVFGSSDLNIVYTSRFFQPCADTFDNRFEFIGPSIGARPASDFPWDQVIHPVLVYVSLGTLFNTDPAFYRNCFEAFGSENCQVVLSTGAATSMASLGRPPANFIVRPHVPQIEVLRRAAAFVTHGGMNSVSESLYHGVPVVVIPSVGEQAIVGRRVEELGAGLYLARPVVTAGTLRDSVRRLLSEDQFRHQAALVRESFQSAGGIPRAVDAILSFTSAARTHVHA